MSDTERATAEFDEFANDYDGALQQGLSLSGEDSSFFAAGRVTWLGRRLCELDVAPTSILDYGCGTGSTVPHLLGLRGAERVVATDESRQLLDLARREHGSDRVRFQTLDEPLREPVELAYCNGVFHHIDPPDRPAALRYIHDALRPGGHFAFWENSPWNPGTRLVMRRIPFDRDAVMISPPGARRLLRTAGFDVLRTDFAFVFPNVLRALRPIEKHLAGLPLGAQYLVLARRPSS